MVCTESVSRFTNSHFKPFVALGFEYNKVNTQAGTAQLGSQVQFSIPQFGDFFNDMVLYVVLDAPTLDAGSNTGANAPTVRWCEYPGIRLLKKVSFDVNGNPLDSYTSDATLMHSKFKVQPNKRNAWKRCMGQEVPLDAYLNEDGTGAPDSHRIKLQVCNGAQTPKAAADSLTLLIPLLFWCNQDPRLAVPSVAIPYGQRFITIDLASAADMVGLQNRGSGTGNTLTTPNISQMSLYINNIFVNPEIHKIFIRRIGFSLIRVHRQQNITTSLSSQEILLQNLKWPIETLFIGMRPVLQKTSLGKWDKFTSLTDTNYKVSRVASIGSTFAGTTAVIATTGSAYAVTITPTWSQAQASAQVSAKTLDTITVTAHGIYLYNAIPASFFSSYTTYTYGGQNIQSDEDDGALMIPFNLYPGTYQPSSHVNISRAREFYISYVSSVIGTGSPVVSGELVVVGSALNFLLISDGSAVLRYST